MSHDGAQPSIAVYPGSFDPATNGHLDVIGRAAKLFDNVIVAVGKNGGKSPLFTPDERVALLSEVCEDRWSNVRVTLFEGLLVEFAQAQGARAMIKGLRAVSDFEYEFQMALANRHLAPELETLFLMTSAEHLYLSSSIVKEIARLGGDVSGLVPETVARRLREKFRSVTAPIPPAERAE